ncbi:MAG: DinB family protein [Solirubrobacterales bacterium]|jgi:hypothetical protein
MTREETLALLETTPAWLEGMAAAIGEGKERTAGPEGAFSLVEHAWHLADLEREGFGERIRRLRDEERPTLPDFDGARVARERAYRSLPLAPAMAAFALTRFANLASLRALGADGWERAGEQEGVGVVRLSDIPRMMAEHDAGHRAEIEALARSLAAPSNTLDAPSP